MGRPKGSKNKNKLANPSGSGARKAVPTNFADTSLGAGTASGSKTRSRSKSKSRSRNTAAPKPDWSTLRYGILLGETKAIKKAFPTQDDALGYVKSLPVTKQAKAKLVTVHTLKVETSISILPVNAPSTTITIGQKALSSCDARELTRNIGIGADALRNPAPAITAALNKVTDMALQAGAAKAAAKAPPVAKAAPKPAPAAHPAKGNGSSSSKSSRLDLIAARAAKLGHTPAGSAKADVALVAATELAVEEPDEPEEDAPDLSEEAE